MNNTQERVPTLFKRKEECCGCTACYAICPTSSITMEEDNEGFLYPNINASSCVYCNACINVCPIKATKHTVGSGIASN